MASGLLNKGLLPARDREVLIGRTTARAGAEYGWGVHAVVFGRSVGLDEAVPAALPTAPSDDPVFDARTRLLVTAADELADDGQLTDATWQGLAAIFEPDRLPLEVWAARFPRSEQRTEQGEQA